MLKAQCSMLNAYVIGRWALDIEPSCSEWARQDSNLGPTDYEPAALTAELRAQATFGCKWKT